MPGRAAYENQRQGSPGLQLRGDHGAGRQGPGQGVGRGRGHRAPPSLPRPAGRIQAHRRGREPPGGGLHSGSAALPGNPRRHGSRPARPLRQHPRTRRLVRRRQESRPEDGGPAGRSRPGFGTNHRSHHEIRGQPAGHRIGRSRPGSRGPGGQPARCDRAAHGRGLRSPSPPDHGRARVQGRRQGGLRPSRRLPGGGEGIRPRQALGEGGHRLRGQCPGRGVGL